MEDSRKNARRARNQQGKSVCVLHNITIKSEVLEILSHQRRHVQHHVPITLRCSLYSMARATQTGHIRSQVPLRDRVHGTTRFPVYFIKFSSCWCCDRHSQTLYCEHLTREFGCTDRSRENIPEQAIGCCNAVCGHHSSHQPCSARRYLPRLML